MPILKNGAIAGGGGGTPFPADGARIGTYIYDDAQYDSTPLSVPANTPTALPNDTLGPLTGNTPVTGVTNLWDPVTGFFDFTELNVGDVVEMRLDLLVQTSSFNQTVNINFEGGIGSPFPFALTFIDGAYLFTGSFSINRYTPIFVIDENTIDYPGRMVIQSSDPIDVNQIRFFCNVTTKGLA